MSGKLTMEPQEYKIKKHDHIQIIFASGQQLIFHDPRRFGMVYGCASDEFDNQLFIKHMGIEPLDSRFNVEYLKTKLQKRSTTIKTAIMDNKIVVGIGNIYIAESLHKSGIHPTRIAAELTHNEIQNLVSAIKIVLTAAIKVGGTTLKNFVNGDNKHGDFKQQLRVYNRTNQQCYTCQTGTIHRIKQAGRSSFFCPNCQRD